MADKFLVYSDGVGTTNPQMMDVPYEYIGELADSLAFMSSGWEKGDYGYHTALDSYVIRGSSSSDIRMILDNTLVIDNLTSTSITQPLSARQGKILKDTIDALPTGGSSAYLESTHTSREAVTSGFIGYFDYSAGGIKHAIDDGTGKDEAFCIIKESKGSIADTPVITSGIVKSTDLEDTSILTALAPGEDYFLSKTVAGGFTKQSDMTAGDYGVRIFKALTSNTIKFYDEPAIIQV